MIIITEVQRGKDPSLYLQDGKCVEIREVVYIMSTIIPEQPRGRGQIQKGYNVLQVGKVNALKFFK